MFPVFSIEIMTISTVWRSTCHFVACDLAWRFLPCKDIINCNFWQSRFACKPHLSHIFLCRDIYGDNDPSRQPERTNEAAGTYAQACIAVAKELGHPVIDIWTLMQQFPDWQTSALSDGLHFTPSGNKILFDEVLKTLESVGFSQHSLRSDLPLFHEIDPKDPLKAFEIWRRYSPHGSENKLCLVWWLMCSVT